MGSSSPSSNAAARAGDVKDESDNMPEEEEEEEKEEEEEEGAVDDGDAGVDGDSSVAASDAGTMEGTPRWGITLLSRGE